MAVRYAGALLYMRRVVELVTDHRDLSCAGLMVLFVFFHSAPFLRSDPYPNEFSQAAVDRPTQCSCLRCDADYVVDKTADSPEEVDKNCIRR